MTHNEILKIKQIKQIKQNNHTQFTLLLTSMCASLHELPRSHRLAKLKALSYLRLVLIRREVQIHLSYCHFPARGYF